MKNLDFLKKSHKGPSSIIYLSLFIATISLAVVLFLHIGKGLSYSILTRDPIQIFNGYAFEGFLSSVGIIFWSATVGVCFISALLTYGEKEKEFKFFLLGLAFSSLLLIDDCFMFHDIILPDYFHISEYFVYALYAVLAILFIIYFRSIVFLTPYYFLFVAVLFLGLSISIDVIVNYIDLTNHYFYEDAAKFIGIIFWWIYFSSVSYLTLKEKLLFP